MVAGGMLQTFDDDVDDAPTSRVEAGLASKMRPSKLAQQQQQGAPSIIYLMSLLSAMGGFLFGYDTGIVSGTMVFVRKVFQLNSLWQELVVSITILGAWVLSLMAGSLSEQYGRKSIILYASVVFTVGSITMGVAWSKYVLLFGRLIVGIAIGLASTVVPMYIAELAPSNIRGSLVTMNNCFITIGQLSAAITAGAFSYDETNGWRWMLSLAAVPAGIQFVGFMFMPESPRWLIRHQRDAEALEALKRIRGKGNSVLKEFEKIRQNQLELVVQEERRKAQKRNIIVAIFRKTATRRALTVGCLLMAAQQLAGINTVMYYTATIFEMSGVQSKSIAVWLAVPTAAVYVVFSLCGYLVADRFGRRSLTLGSLLGVILSLLVLGTGFHLTSLNGAPVTAFNMSTLETCYTKRDCATCIAEPRCGFCYDTKTLSAATCLEKSATDETKSIGGNCALANTDFMLASHICPSLTQGIGLNTWLVLIGLVLYLCAFAPGMGPMPWTINSEIYPGWARSFCYSIATSVNWMFNLLISLTFISLTEAISTYGAFYMYSIISSVCWILLFWKLPETRGRSLEEVSSLFAKQAKQTDDRGDVLDGDATSANQSTHGANTMTGVSQLVGFNQLATIADSAKHTGCGSKLCHENLAFAADNMSPPLHKSAKTNTNNACIQTNAIINTNNTLPPPFIDTQILLERSKSFKMSPLLNSKHQNMALSQPDLPQHYLRNQHQHQHQHTSPELCGPFEQTELQPALTSSPKAEQTEQFQSQQQQIPSQFQMQLFNQHQTKRKYSDGVGP